MSQRFGKALLRLLYMTALKPEEEQAVDQAQPYLCSILCLQAKLQCVPQVVMFALHTMRVWRQRAPCAYTFGPLKEVVPIPATHSVRLPALYQLFGRVLPHRLQQ